jgi:hypothetical protein
MLQDGITLSTDTALRDFSARCLHEFVVWSVKQDSHVNIKAIMKQIYSFCLHPCPSKRLGEWYFLLELEKKVKSIHEDASTSGFMIVYRRQKEALPMLLYGSENWTVKSKEIQTNSHGNEVYAKDCKIYMEGSQN